MLCLIGESFDECSDEICGAVINIRPKGDKLGLWTRNATQKDANIKIGLFSDFVAFLLISCNCSEHFLPFGHMGCRKYFVFFGFVSNFCTDAAVLKYFY